MKTLIKSYAETTMILFTSYLFILCAIELLQK